MVPISVPAAHTQLDGYLDAAALAAVLNAGSKPAWTDFDKCLSVWATARDGPRRVVRGASCRAGLPDCWRMLIIAGRFVGPAEAYHRVVSPNCGCRDCLRELTVHVEAAASTGTEAYELVLFDDASPDESWA